MMYVVPTFIRCPLWLGLCLASAAMGVHAQAVVPVMAPGSASVSSPSPVAAPAPSSNVAAPTLDAVPAARGRSPFVGATARHLLESQASGRIAAPAQPMSGVTASASWKRYVDTFSHPVPEFFESRVGKKTSQ
jgi:hypothetical protein